MSVLDWSILLVYIAAALGIGVWMQRRASSSVEQYFAAGRSLPWWLIGTSMVATTFAADTPLAVTGFVANNGIAGNWLWWSWAFGHIAAVFFFSRMWRRAEAITDAELIELRYHGKPAAVLRGFKAFYFAIPINCITMAWVLKAMGKIVQVIFPWEQWLGPETYGALEAIWPSGIGIATPSEGLSLLLGATVATTYAALGGLPTVILTDIAQFTFAMVGSILLAVFAIQHVGGLGELTVQLQNTYGVERAEGILAFFPGLDAAWLPLNVFLVYVLVSWWAQKFSDGGGYLMQRMAAARTEEDALRGTAWFVVAHYALRPWPWILVGLVALVVYPLDAPGTGELALLVAEDREMAYPALMYSLLPSGALGILVTGMAAAFMSTIDTHITWGSSYFVRDFYQRFVKPEASDRELVRVARFGIVLMVVLALVFTLFISSIGGAWKFFTLMGAGAGIIAIVRWLWWRVNAYSELAAIITAALTTLLLTAIDEQRFIQDDYHVGLLIVVGASAAATFAVTLLTR
ncbi:MAG: sodium:solute symporter family protein, partial [Myxococcota bacterium]